MRALVVYESQWGNTERVARAIATELHASMEVELVDSDTAPTTLAGFDLACVGGPRGRRNCAATAATSSPNSSPFGFTAMTARCSTVSWTAPRTGHARSPAA